LKNKNIDAVFGDIGIVDKNDRLIRTNKYLKFDYASGVFNGFGKIISSNAIFWKKQITDEVGFFDVSFNYAMDAEYWSRLLYNRNVRKISEIIAFFRWHEQSKTILRKNKNSMENNMATDENARIRKKSYENLKLSRYIRYNYSMPIYYYYRLKRIIIRGFIGEYFKKNK